MIIIINSIRSNNIVLFNIMIKKTMTLNGFKKKSNHDDRTKKHSPKSKILLSVIPRQPHTK